MVIVGVDPGSRTTGFGVVSVQGNHLRCLEYGAISAGKLSFSDRLRRIHAELNRVLERWKPDALAVENIFYAVNVKSALTLGHARGVILLAGAQWCIPLAEYSALQIKKAVVGYGKADKRQVQMMVSRLLNLPQKPEPLDAADALAIAVCHAFNRPALAYGAPRSGRHDPPGPNQRAQ